MKTFQVLRLLVLAGITPFVASIACAQDSYYYGGIGVGKARSNFDAARATEVQGPAGLTISDISRDAKHSAYKVFLGYQVNRNLGFELGYFHLGQFGFISRTSAGTLEGHMRVQGANADVVGTFPITDNFSLLGRAGVQVARTRDEFIGSGGFVPRDPSPAECKANIKVGVGLQYAFSPGFMVRTEVERYRINDAVGGHPNVNMYSASLVLPFGRSTGPAPRMAAAPVYTPIAQAPAPAPAPAPLPPVMAAPAPVAVAVVPAPLPRQRVSYSAESMFGFDRTAIQPEGKAALDTFARELQGTTFDSISVEGHTDRLGTEVYNQKLSLERADIVKAYLVDSGKVDASRIQAVGKGETAPVTKAEDCQGQRATAKLIACLTPDRRVEIEVAGTR